jgi:hypothetical protein
MFRSQLAQTFLSFTREIPSSAKIAGISLSFSCSSSLQTSQSAAFWEKIYNDQPIFTSKMIASGRFNIGSTGINGMETQILKVLGDEFSQHLQNLDISR